MSGSIGGSGGPSFIGLHVVNVLPSSLVQTVGTLHDNICWALQCNENKSKQNTICNII